MFGDEGTENPHHDFLKKCARQMTIPSSAVLLFRPGSKLRTGRRQSVISPVPRRDGYNTLDFAKQNRVPTGMLRAPIGNPAAKRCSLCNPSFSSQVHIQTAKTQLATTAQKMQKEACAGTWHRLPFGRKCRRRRGVFFCIPAIRCGGDGGGRIETGVLAIKKSWIVYRLQHYENRRLFDFLLRTEPTVDAT